jgi:hypothetical protein
MVPSCQQRHQFICASKDIQKNASNNKNFLISLANTFDLIKAFIFHKNHSSSLEFASDKKGLAKFSKTKNGMSNTLLQH